jgi:hypothetical protein
MHQLGTSKPSDPQSGTEPIVYDASADPRTIDITLNGIVNPPHIAVAAYADGQVQIGLSFVDANGTNFGVTSKFVAGGAGTAQYTIRTAVGFTDTITECWDALYCRSYIKDLGGWLRPPCTSAFCELGDKSTCPSVH